MFEEKAFVTPPKPELEKEQTLVGLPLLLTVLGVTHLSFLRKAAAKSSIFLQLRALDDIEDHPATYAIPSKYLNSPENAEFDQPFSRLNPEHRSVSPYLSFWDYHEAYTSQKTTPTQVAEKLLQTIDRHNKDMHWIRFLEKDILKRAEESTQRYKSGTTLSQMDGVFVTVKEEINIRGIETKLGTSFINDGKPAEYDSTIVAKFRQAGAIVIGSAIMNELGWDTFTVNPNTGTPKNPFKPSHSCGGSSGGSSGMVAAGIVPVSIGTDAGGSIRIPSSFCGLYGLKTTFSRVSAYGCTTHDPTVGAYGPIAATADDMALTYCIISGPDSNDLNTLMQPPLSLRNYDLYKDISDLTIGILPDWNKNASEPAILERFNYFKKQLTQIGAKFVEIEIEDLEWYKIALLITTSCEMYNYCRKFKNDEEKFLCYTRLLTQLISEVEAHDYIRAQQLRTRAMNQFRDVFENKGIDLLMTPATAILSPEIPEKALVYGMSNAYLTGKAMEFTSIANFTGLPGVSVPAGYYQGLPIGLQFISSWWNEAVLLRIAKACERLPGNERRRPDEHWYSNELI